MVVVGVGSLSQTYKDKLLDLVDSSDDLHFAKDFDELLKEEFIKHLSFDLWLPHISIVMI